MVFKKKKKVVSKNKVEEPEEEEEEEEEDEDDDEDAEETEEPEDKELPPMPEQEKAIVKGPNRQEMEDMIEGHLFRASEILKLLRGLK